MFGLRDGVEDISRHVGRNGPETTHTNCTQETTQAPIIGEEMNALIFVINCLAAYRIIRFIQLDTIFDGPRDWILNGLNRKKLKKLLVCPFCISVWVAVLVFFADRYAEFLWHPVATILAISAVAGALAYADHDLT